MPRLLALLLLVALSLLTGCGGDDSAADSVREAAADVDGRLEAGLRVLTIDPAAPDQEYRIYRGDYIRPELVGATSFTLRVPALAVDKTFPVAEGERSYIKVPDAGRFEFQIGDLSGVIEAIDYRAAAYREVNARDGAAFIDNLDPVILDVRTSREFAGGHLEGAQLVPVQRFKQRLGELMPYRERPVFVYCRTGNRSTVAAKMLVDAGFTNVVNLRRGIVEWRRAGLPVVK